MNNINRYLHFSAIGASVGMIVVTASIANYIAMFAFISVVGFSLECLFWQRQCKLYQLYFDELAEQTKSLAESSTKAITSSTKEIQEIVDKYLILAHNYEELSQEYRKSVSILENVVRDIKDGKYNVGLN